MADTVARLIFETDTKGLDDANKKLDDLGKVGQATGGKLPKKPLKETATAAEKLSSKFSNAATATAALQGPLNGLSGRLSFISTGLNKIGIAGLAMSTAFFGLAMATRKALTEFQQFETQMFRIEALIQSTGGAAGLTSGQINQLAQDLGKLTLASQVEMRDAAAVLLTFKAITAEVFEDTLRLTQDIGAVMGQTATSGAKQLGKALEDPTRNMEALRRVGVSFDDAQKTLIRNMQRSGDIVGAQTQLIKILQGQLGGAGTGGGVAAATDLLANNTHNLAISFVNATGAGDKYSAFLNGLADALEFFTGPMTAEGRLAEVNEQIANFQPSILRDVLEVGKALLGPTATAVEDPMERLKAKRDALEVEVADELEAQFHKEAIRQENIDKINAANVAEFEAFKKNSDLKRLAALESEAALTGNLRQAAVIRAHISMQQADQERDAAIKKHGDLEVFEETHQAKMKQIRAQFDKDITDITQAEVDESDKASKEAERIAAEKEAKEQAAADDLMASKIHAAELQMNLDDAHTLKMERLVEQQQIELEAAQGHEELLTTLKAKHEQDRANLEERNRKEKLKFDQKAANLHTKINMQMAKSALSILQSLGANSKKVQVAMIAAEVGVGLAENQIATQVSMARALSDLGPIAGPPVSAKMAVLGKIRAASIIAAGAMKIHGATSGGGGGGGGAASTGSDVAAQFPTGPLQEEEVFAPERIINVTINDSIDPSGARRIVEALNEAAEDGLQINALVN